MSFRAFKHVKRTATKSIAEAAYTKATESLLHFNIPRARGKCKVFVKTKPDQWPNSTNVSNIEFDNALLKPVHNDISAPMRAFLQSNKYI